MKIPEGFEEIEKFKECQLTSVGYRSTTRILELSIVIRIQTTEKLQFITFYLSKKGEKNVFSRGLYSVNLEGHTIVESRKQEKNLSSTFFRVFTYFWKGKSLDAARSSEGETVTADFLPNLGELQGELGAEPDPTEPSDGVALDPKLS